MKFHQKYLITMMTLAILLFVLTGCGQADSAEDSSSSTQETALTFPYELENGKLVVNSMFQSSIFNPDCENEEGEDIASLEIVNSSEEYLKEAHLTVTLTDGTKIPFTITNIPAGKTVCAFAADNASITLEAACGEIDCEAEFEEEASMLSESISFEIEGTEITLKNEGEEDLKNLSVCCHCLFNGTYFGGLTYMYPVKTLSAGSTAAISAGDCYLGSAEIVSILQNEK